MFLILSVISVAVLYLLKISFTINIHMEIYTCILQVSSFHCYKLNEMIFLENSANVLFTDRYGLTKKRKKKKKKK